MSEELSGIVKEEDPTFVPNMEPKGYFCLQIMRDVTKVLEDCFEVGLSKHALERVQHVFAVAIYVGSG